MKNKSKHEILLGTVSLIILAGVIGVVFSARHSLEAWGELFNTGWPALLVAVLVGIARGVVQAKWEQHHWLTFIVHMFSFGLIVLLGARLILELAHKDIWAAMVVCVVYLGTYFATWRLAISLCQRNETPSPDSD